jgi:hypothetical protein
MNHDDTSRRSPARELMPYGLKRAWNDDSTTTTIASIGRTGGGGGGGGGIGGRPASTTSSNKRPRGILAQFESISVHDDDDDKDDDDDDFHPDVSLLQDENAMDNSGDVAVAGSRDRYSSSLSRAEENEVDEYHGYHADDGIDRFSCDDDEDDQDDDDKELLSDEELFKRRLEKQVYV